MWAGPQEGGAAVPAHREGQLEIARKSFEFDKRRGCDRLKIPSLNRVIH